MSTNGKIDLRQLFQLPVKQIHFPSEKPKENQAGSQKEEPKDSDTIYQVVKLNKILGQRYTEGAEGAGLDFVDGLTVVDPDTEFLPSILSELIYDPNNTDKCELLLVVAMYNEGVEHFKNTMVGIANNLKTFVRYGIHPKKIGCCLIIDGIRPFFSTIRGVENEFTRRFFEQFFDEQRILKRFNVENPLHCKIPNEEEVDEFAHVFMQNIVLDDEGMFPLQFFFTIKQKNRRKLNTHLWFFGGFCEMIQPKYVMLIDVGTKPLKNSLFFMYEAMKIDLKLAGCCGEIKPMNTTIWKLVVPAQEVEYKFSHIFDKALESIIGYITVLPGAFSAYRWEALQGVPLWVDYFKSICHPEEMGPFNSNIYLAEDRVLCLALVSKKDAAYTLRYVRGSVAETDVPESISELMSQRRRWINGSWFALIDSLKNFAKIHKSDHSCCRKCAFSLQMMYYYISVIFSWFMVGSFYMVFSATARIQFGSSLDSFGAYLILVYAVLLMIVFILALGVKPSRTNDMYKGIATLFGLYMLVVFYLTFAYIFGNLGSSDEVDLARWAMIGTFAMFLFNIIINCCLSTICKGLLHFLFMIPTYVNVFLIYAICNTHDCSWGNRPDVMTAEEMARVEEFEEFRARWTIVWVLTNGGFGWLLTTLSSENPDEQLYVFGIAFMGVGILSFRTFGGVLYVLKEKCFVGHLKKSKSNDLYNRYMDSPAGNKTTYTRKNTLRRTASIKQSAPKESAVSPMTKFEEPSTAQVAHTRPVITLEDPESSSFVSSQMLSDESFEEESKELSSSVESSEEEEEEGEDDSGDLEDSKDFKFLLKYAKEELNMSLSYLSEEMQISKKRLQQIENGEIEPNEDEQEQILRAVEPN